MLRAVIGSFDAAVQSKTRPSEVWIARLISISDEERSEAVRKNLHSTIISAISMENSPL